MKARSEDWRAGVKWATLDLSAAFRSVFVATLPEATLVADPFHVVKHANSKLDECRRRVQNETLGHRGRKADPLFRSRRLLTMAKQRLSEDAEAKMVGLLKAGDRKGEVATSWATRKKPFASSMPTLMRQPLLSGLTNSLLTWPIAANRLRSARSGEPSKTGATRSLPGTGPTPATDQLKRSTTW